MYHLAATALRQWTWGAETRRQAARLTHVCQNGQTSKNKMAAWSRSMTTCRWPKTQTIHYPPPRAQLGCFLDVCVCLSWRKENGSRRTINLGPIKSDRARCQLGPRLRRNFDVWNFYNLVLYTWIFYGNFILHLVSGLMAYWVRGFINQILIFRPLTPGKGINIRLFPIPIYKAESVCVQGQGSQ